MLGGVQTPPPFRYGIDYYRMNLPVEPVTGAKLLNASYVGQRHCFRMSAD